MKAYGFSMLKKILDSNESVFKLFSCSKEELAQIIFPELSLEAEKMFDQLEKAINDELKKFIYFISNPIQAKKLQYK